MAKKRGIKRKIIIILLIVVVLVAALIILGKTGDEGNLNPVQRFARQALAQVSRLGAGFSNFFDFSTKRGLEAELEALQQELAQYKADNQLMTSVSAENQRLQELLGYKEELGTYWESTVARVTGREPDNWHDLLLLDKGSDDGIAADMAVVNYQGLVGRVVDVTDTTSKVRLIIDPMGSLGGMVEANRSQGVLEGIGGGKGLLNFKNLPYSADIQLGAVVVTSGVGQVFPEGLRVGTIAKVSTSLDGLSKQAVVEPFCDFDRIEEVLILTGTATTPAEGDMTEDETAGDETEENTDGETDSGEDAG